MSRFASYDGTEIEFRRPPTSGWSDSTCSGTPPPATSRCCTRPRIPGAWIT